MAGDQFGSGLSSSATAHNAGSASEIGLYPELQALCYLSRTFT